MQNKDSQIAHRTILPRPDTGAEYSRT
jgi:hypothetical protein